MINAPQLLKDLQRQLKDLEDDLRERVGAVAGIDAGLREQHQAAREAQRTGDAYEVWRDGFLTQAAVAWILGCVFVRFLEDNALIDSPLLSGPGERRRLALDQHELYFRHPDRRAHSDRDYLLHCFDQVRAHPAAAELFDPKHNALWLVGPSGDGATRLLGFWQRLEPDTGALAHDFTDPEWGTRFLGDLYQDLSEAARKRYALLQTPEFVEEFILDRTLTPAIEEFGFQEVRLIDPTCGSGHFLLGAFWRLFDLWVANEPGTNPRALAQRALDQVFGVDLNPYAVAIARFRLLIAALKASGVHSIRREEAPAFHVNVAAGDSLLHGARFLSAADRLSAHSGKSGDLGIGSGAEQLARLPGIGHAFLAEDLEALNRILGQHYHAVVGNPPYITVKDKALNQLYRGRYETCHMKYGLGVPFTERFFQLAVENIHHEGTKDTKGIDGGAGAGFVGMITANSFMKREFGKKLIEEFFPRVDLTHVIDTSGAYIPGHGTPTVILFGRDRPPVGETVRTVMGIKGEPTTPDDPAQGLVWSAILAQVDRAGSESEWVSAADTPRDTFGVHPWSIGGGGAADLKESIEACSPFRLAELIQLVGVFGMTNADDAMLAPNEGFCRAGVESDAVIRLVVGDEIRDWQIAAGTFAIFPYRGEDLLDINEAAGLHKWLWPCRTTMGNRATFAKFTYFYEGRPWWEWHQVGLERLREPFTITLAFVATHNHFVLDRGGKVFKQSAPIIKLPAGASEDDHLALIGLLNSSIACFWMKQVFHNKGSTVDTKGARQTTDAFENFYEFTGTGLKQFPVTAERPLDLATELDRLARELAACAPSVLLGESNNHHEGTKDTKNASLILPSCPSCLRGEKSPREALDQARDRATALRRRMIALQEELDWRCYRIYGITAEELTLDPRSVPEIDLGERAFEIVLARRMAEGELTSTWFERHGSTPITEPLAHWPEDYRRMVQRRISLIERDRNLALIERPEYKRRWNTESWESQEQRALRGWLLDRLETPAYWPDLGLQTTRRLADLAATDAEFMQVGELYRARPDFDVHALVAELTESEAVPFLPVLRYKPSGLRTRALWERTWDLQRREDAIDLEVEQEMHDEATKRDEEIHHEGTKSTKEELEKDSSRPSCLRGANPEAIQQEQRRRKQQEIGDIPPPPKYGSADFINTTCWRLRGALDVPKERFVSFPHCARVADPSLVVAWAGWDHLQQAQALAAYHLAMKEQEGWTPERLIPLLAGLTELIPWVRQWHNAPDPALGGARMGDYFADFVQEEARELRLSPEQIRSWEPPTPTRRGRKSKQ